MMVMHLSISTTLIKNSHNIIYIQNQKQHLQIMCTVYVQYVSHTFACDMYIFRISCLTINKNKMLRGLNGSRL